MRTRQPTTTTLENLRIPVQAKLTAAWTSLMFFVIYIDYFHLYQPGAIDQIRGGGIFEFDITPTLVTIFLVVIGIPALMVMLSMTLPARVNRATNLVVASLYIPVMVSTLQGRPGTGPSTTASPSDSRCCSWPSSCAPPGPGPAAPHHRRPWQPAWTGSRSARRSTHASPPPDHPSRSPHPRARSPASASAAERSVPPHPPERSRS